MTGHANPASRLPKGVSVRHVWVRQPFLAPGQHFNLTHLAQIIVPARRSASSIR